MNTYWARFSTYIVLFAFLGAGCTSLFSGEAPKQDPSEVVGTYTIQQFEFIPLASALDPINMLNYVERQGSTLELTESQDFILTYRTQEGKQVKLTGPFDISSDRITVKGQQKDEARFKRILLTPTFSLDRASSKVLRLENQTKITPEALGSWYEGMNQVEGTLRLEFSQEAESKFGAN